MRRCEQLRAPPRWHGACSCADHPGGGRRMKRLLLALLIAGCAGHAEDEAPLAAGDSPEVVEKASLSRVERVARAGLIRDAARAAGLENGLLLTGIAEAETNLAH